MNIEIVAVDGIPIELRKRTAGYLVTGEDLIDLREIAERTLQLASFPEGKTRVVKELNDWIDRIEDSNSL